MGSLVNYIKFFCIQEYIFTLYRTIFKKYITFDYHSFKMIFCHQIILAWDFKPNNQMTRRHIAVSYRVIDSLLDWCSKLSVSIHLLVGEGVNYVIIIIKYLSGIPAILKRVGGGWDNASVPIFHLKVLTNEKRGGLSVVSFERSPYKPFSLKFSNILVQAPSCERHKIAPRTLFLLFANYNCFPIALKCRADTLFTAYT